MRILLFTLEYPPFKGGVANFYGNITKYWPSRAKSSEDKTADEIIVLNNNNGKLVNARWPFLKWLPSIFKLKKAVKKEKIDHILVGHILPLGSAALLNNKLTGVPYSVILHGMDLTLALKPWRKKWLTEKILKNASHIICASNFTAGIVKRVIGDREVGKIEVVNPGVENHQTWNTEHGTRLRKKYNLDNKIILFSVGRLVKRKGFDKVIEAIPDILKEVPNLVYVIAGIGPDEDYFKSLSINYGDILFLGRISDEEKWEWLDLCDIFTMPSRQIGGDFEGFGIVYLEASLAGKPIVAGRSGGAGDAVINNETGFLVNPEDTKEIAYYIIKLAKDDGLRKNLGDKGKERAVDYFSWEKQVNKIFKKINPL